MLQQVKRFSLQFVFPVGPVSAPHILSKIPASVIGRSALACASLSPRPLIGWSAAGLSVCLRLLSAWPRSCMFSGICLVLVDRF